MAVCELIRSGYDMTCYKVVKKYYQQCVLVNRSDILNKLIQTSFVDIEGEYTCRHRVLFNLKPSKTGYRFSLGENATSIFGTADKLTVDGIPQYTHTVNIAMLGFSEAVKCILNQMDNSDFFAALQLTDGTVEIFGFEYGLSSGNYSYDPANNGGAVLKLVSLQDSPEDELPFIYKSGTTGGESADFDNNFADNVFEINGDFNDDFNNDFNNQ